MSDRTETTGPEPADDRTGELLLLWHHDPTTVERCRVIDAEGGALRVRLDRTGADRPLEAESVGTVFGRLPDGRDLRTEGFVTWVRHDDDGWEASLRLAA